MGIQIFSNTNALITAAVDLFIKSAGQAIHERDSFTVALSGGSTPQPLYETLANDKIADDLPWNKIHFFWGDERSVPPDHPESNFGLANRKLLIPRAIPARNIHRIRGELDPAAAAESYQVEILEFFQDSPPRFDLILLGMGADGHTASLFPGTKAVIHHADQQWIAANHVPQLDTWRISFTPKLINHARQVIFMVAGLDKAPTLQQVLEGSHQPDVLPSQLINPLKGQLIWMVDQKASSSLNLE